MFNTNRCYFDENESWYRNQVEETLQLIQKTGSMVEINTRGYYRYGQSDLYPGRAIVSRIAELGIPVVINSDCHAPNEISNGMPYAAQFLNELNIHKVMILHDGIWKSCPVSEKGIEIATPKA